MVTSSMTSLLTLVSMVGRVGEVASGSCDYPTASPLAPDKLPPPGPYVGAKTVFEISGILNDAIDLIDLAGNQTDEARIAVDALKGAIKKLGL
ncbi:MAG: hypothetical protein ACOY4T_12575 [Pseudomonadota bacterium]